MSKKLSLIDLQKNVPIPKMLLRLEPARVSRYLIVANLIKQIIGTNEKPKILDVGGKKGLLREFGIKSTIFDMEESDEKDYIQGDALHMPFADSSFDVVVSCDVLEHIPEKFRDKFITEMVRVTKEYVVIGAPFSQGGVGKSEVTANDFYRDISGEEHRWLEEHIENGLPDRRSTEKFLDNKKFAYSFFEHLSLDTWELTTRIHFLNAVFGDSKAIDELSMTAYREYYASLCDLDFSENGYRTFCVINKKTSFKIDLPDKATQTKTKTAFNKFLNEIFVKALKDFAVDRRAEVGSAINEQQKLLRKNVKLQSNLTGARLELSEIKKSKSWLLSQKISRAKNFYK